MKFKKLIRLLLAADWQIRCWIRQSTGSNGYPDYFVKTHYELYGLGKEETEVIEAPDG